MKVFVVTDRELARTNELDTDTTERLQSAASAPITGSRPRRYRASATRSDLSEASVQVAQLPFVDDHSTHIAADIDDVWSALVDAVEGAFSGAAAGWYARAVGCADHVASGPRPSTSHRRFPGSGSSPRSAVQSSCCREATASRTTP